MLKLTKIGIVGAGNMGAGIAQKIAQEGCGVVLNDISQDFLDRAVENINHTLQEGIKRKILPEGIEREVASRIKTSTDLREMAGCQLIVEAVFEDPSVKKELFKKLDEICPPETVFATNTSTLSVKEMAAATGRPDRVIGLHFFFPPAINRLLEIIFLEETSEETRAVGDSLTTLLGKVGISAADAPGFAVNRFFIPWANEAVRLLDEGVGDIPSIDHTAKETFKVGMGPFLFMSATGGIPLAYHTTTILGQRISKFYGPPAGLGEKFRSGKPWDLSGDPKPESFQKIQDRLLGVIFWVAASLVDEGIASIVDTDIGAKIGLRWGVGPFEMMNRMGIEKAYSLAQSIVDRHSDLKMPSNFKEKYEKGEQWDIRYVSLTKKGPIAYVTIKRPEVLNALSETIISQLSQCLDEIESDASVNSVVIGSLGKEFVAGADIGFFLDRIKANRFEDIEAYGQRGHEILNRIENSKKLMIARVQGLALGGGLELALACHTIVASDKAAFGFPETSIGIYPGFGGMQRSIRKVGKPLAKYLVLAGKVLDAATALKMGLIEYMMPAVALDERIVHISSDPSPLTKRSKSRPHLSAELLKIEELFDNNQIDRLLLGKGIEKDDLAQGLASAISSKAPLAIKTANMIMDQGEKMPLKEALELERSHARDIFRSEDALLGLMSVGKGMPHFKGK